MEAGDFAHTTEYGVLEGVLRTLDAVLTSRVQQKEPSHESLCQVNASPGAPASSLNAEPFVWTALWTSCSPRLQADVTTWGQACPATPFPEALPFPLPSLLASFTSPTEANKVKHYLSFFFFKREHPVQPPMWEDSHLFYFQVKHSDWQSFDDKQMCWNPAGVLFFPTEAL